MNKAVHYSKSDRVGILVQWKFEDRSGASGTLLPPYTVLHELYGYLQFLLYEHEPRLWVCLTFTQHKEKKMG